LTSVEDARAVVTAGADAVGLNFFGRSKRFIEEPLAREIIESLPAGVVKVGLFVNAPAEEVRRKFDQLHLDLIQLHGDEPPEYLAELADRPVMRAFRLGPAGLEPVKLYIQRCRQLGSPLEIVLLDGHVQGEYGGTGEVADWSVAAQYTTERENPPLVLAGGLTSENVAQAIEAVGPVAVDTASGVESSPGRKDPARVTSFVRAAVAAFDRR